MSENNAPASKKRPRSDTGSTSDEPLPAAIGGRQGGSNTTDLRSMSRDPYAGLMPKNITERPSNHDERFMYDRWTGPTVYMGLRAAGNHEPRVVQPGNPNLQPAHYHQPGQAGGSYNTFPAEPSGAHARRQPLMPTALDESGEESRENSDPFRAQPPRAIPQRRPLMPIVPDQSQQQYGGNNYTFPPPAQAPQAFAQPICPGGHPLALTRQIVGAMNQDIKDEMREELKNELREEIKEEIKNELAVEVIQAIKGEIKKEIQDGIKKGLEALAKGGDHGDL
ncbi:Hypothetical predicted protein [Lecanosticta acicola]|uniref:Uncharacterized protein n=1 Tax=Lecanosticta acicola TaxID=111012 RepID=A0AAI9E797_9PEZI|nr:Hypothetical predicted protein [Lecanosticta acicola]